MSALQNLRVRFAHKPLSALDELKALKQELEARVNVSPRVWKLDEKAHPVKHTMDLPSGREDIQLYATFEIRHGDFIDLDGKHYAVTSVKRPTYDGALYEVHGCRLVNGAKLP